MYLIYIGLNNTIVLKYQQITKYFILQDQYITHNLNI